MNTFLGLIAPVYAQISADVVNPLQGKVTNLQTAFQWITNLIMAVGLSLVVVMLALGFIKYITSQGDKTAVETAQKWVTYSAIGGVGLFFVYTAKSIIRSIFGTELNLGQNVVIGDGNNGSGTN